MIRPYSLEKSYELLDIISQQFVAFLNNLMEITEVNEINLIGTGNSISAGWTAVNNNVCPWLDKLKPFVLANKSADTKINFATFSLAGQNANRNILEFLNNNPSLTDVRNHFITVFDGWKNDFNGTLFENYVDKTAALSFYPEGDKRLFDYYSDESFSITSFFGCTGELINDVDKIKDRVLNGEQLKEVIALETTYLEKIINLLTNLSENSYVTVGNFPLIARKWLFFLNNLINKFNKEIEKVASNNDKTLYFAEAKLDLINVYNGKIKIDNHPNLEWQYTTLYNYVIFLMQYLPLELIKNKDLSDELLKKYEGLDFDGQLQARVKKYIKKR